MPRPTIVVIEDDPAIRRGVVDALTFEHYPVLQADRGDTGRRLVLESECDLVLLDLVLPGLDGLAVLAEVRAARPALPVIILTARGEERDRVSGLKLGADDYVVKPFSVTELLARVEAVLRRSAERPRTVPALAIPGGQADLARAEVTFTDGSRTALSVREVELLDYLARNPGRVITREEILQRVWRLDPAGLETRTIDMHIARLREKLRDDPADPRVVVTVRGKGYRLAR